MTHLPGITSRHHCYMVIAEYHEGMAYHAPQKKPHISLLARRGV